MIGETEIICPICKRHEYTFCLIEGQRLCKDIRCHKIYQLQKSLAKDIVKEEEEISLLCKIDRVLKRIRE
jgi:hypothetical protein